MWYGSAYHCLDCDGTVYVLVKNAGAGVGKGRGRESVEVVREGRRGGGLEVGVF